MTQEELKESFETWWIEEGKEEADRTGGQTTDLHKIKSVFLTAWLNGAYIAKTHNA